MIAFVTGRIWYSRNLFGRGFHLETPLGRSKNLARTLVITFLIAFSVSVISQRANPDNGLLGAITLGFWLWVILTSVNFLMSQARQPVNIFLVPNFYWLVALIEMAAVVSVLG